MPKPDSPFEALVRDLLTPLGNITVRRMFGGTGYYHDSTFFALCIQDTLYFKTSAKSRKAYIAAGTEPFTYATYRGPVTLKRYYEVPHPVLDDDDLFVKWAKKAVESARLVE